MIAIAESRRLRFQSSYYVTLELAVRSLSLGVEKLTHSQRIAWSSCDFPLWAVSAGGNMEDRYLARTIADPLTAFLGKDLPLSMLRLLRPDGHVP